MGAYTVMLAPAINRLQPLHRRFSLTERRVKTGGGQSGFVAEFVADDFKVFMLVARGRLPRVGAEPG